MDSEVTNHSTSSSKQDVFKRSRKQNTYQIYHHILVLSVVFHHTPNWLCSLGNSHVETSLVVLGIRPLLILGAALTTQRDAKELVNQNQDQPPAKTQHSTTQPPTIDHRPHNEKQSTPRILFFFIRSSSCAYYRSSLRISSAQ